ncbi:MAG: ester cyclase [Myxococcota bacterium]
MEQTHNKAAVQRFNREVIERGDAAAFRALVAETFVNRSAPPGSDGRDGMWAFFASLRPALTDLRVEVHDLVAEGDRVATRKTIRGRHTGALFGVPATQEEVAIEVIDLVRLEGGQYVEHWGQTDLPAVLGRLAAR